MSLSTNTLAYSSNSMAPLRSKFSHNDRERLTQDLANADPALANAAGELVQARLQLDGEEVTFDIDRLDDGLLMDLQRLIDRHALLAHRRYATHPDICSTCRVILGCSSHDNPSLSIVSSVSDSFVYIVEQQSASR